MSQKEIISSFFLFHFSKWNLLFAPYIFQLDIEYVQLNQFPI